MATMYIFALLIFFGIPTALIGVCYYLDYKRDKKYFISGIKGSFKRIAAFIIVPAIVSSLFGWLNKMIFPLDQDYGSSKNPTRIELGIPTIEEDWIEQPGWGDQYSQWYSSNIADSTFKHEKKWIEFDMWGAVLEEDYFESPNSTIKLLTRYDYESKKLTYFKIEPIPIDEQEWVDEKGRVNPNPRAVREIELTKVEFENAMEELKKETTINNGSDGEV